MLHTITDVLQSIYVNNKHYHSQKFDIYPRHADDPDRSMYEQNTFNNSTPGVTAIGYE